MKQRQVIRIDSMMATTLALCLGTALLVSCASTPSATQATDTIKAPPAQATVSDTSLSTSRARCVLRWQTETESNTFGYYVYRADTPEQEFVCINIDNPLHAKGTSTSPRKYVYYDLTVAPDKTYYYKLQSRDLDGSTEWIIGADKPAAGKGKPLSETEITEIRTKGKAYGEDTAG